MNGDQVRVSWRVLTSVPFLTLVILLLIDWCLRQGNPADALGYNSVDQWNLPTHYKVLRLTSPDVALVGSSLMLTLNQNGPDEFIPSRIAPAYLQQRLRRLTGKNITCLNMCTGGQMASESYLIVRALADQPDCPPVIIYGTALRDFLYEPCMDERQTRTFLSSAPFAPVDLETVSLMSMNDVRVEFLLSHFWYLYRNRRDFKNIASALTKNALEHLPLDEHFERTDIQAVYRPSSSGWLWEECVARKPPPTLWMKNQDVLSRFIASEQLSCLGPHRDQVWSEQTRYFENMLSFCRRRGILVVVVEMPLSAKVRQLVPEPMNLSFRHYLAVTAMRNGAGFLAYLGDPQFPPDAFLDGAHLKYEPSRQLAERLAGDIKDRYPDVLRTISEHARRREASNRAREREDPYFKLGS